MLSVSQLSKSFGIETILDGVSFQLNPGDRFGLVGPNGCGKTTLLRILAGEERPDSGSFHFNPPNLRWGYLPQGLPFHEEETVAMFLNRIAGDLDGLTRRLEELATRLAANPNQADDHGEYDQILSRLSLASENSGRGPAVLSGLGLGQVAFDSPVAHLSGGQKTRLGLAGVLLAAPQLLLLDEPTNHLDLEMLTWLEDWLVHMPVRTPIGVLLVSHDRAFLDQVVNGILEIDPRSHHLRAYSGNYTDYLEQKLAEKDKQWQAYSDQQVEVERLKTAARHLRGIAQFRKGGKADSGDKYARGFFANRALATVGRAKHIEARLEKLLEEERVDKPRDDWQMKLEFSGAPQTGRDVVVLEELAIGYGENRLLSGLNQTMRAGARVVLVGPNGAGKTTLLRTIAGLIPPLAGRARLGPSVRAGYMMQEQEDLDSGLNALQTIQRILTQSETEARNFLHYFLFSGDDVFTPVGSLSYGERARLSLACLVAQGCNLLLLDEPLNHLDIPSRARFEQALAKYPGSVLAVVHDRYFIQGFASEIWEVKGKGIGQYEVN
ncbi:MAG: ABC-F family ATP-binding cassette domain-containing protein [Anaerolineaceae bacterium]|nr:ABC-F family ATP-binding cassette domain-containing protein [Anaerolineaceae bacterium]